ncbi:MAG: PKD domain-containing protein, partial [Candidatus Thorarchaeota archaeon]
GQVIFTSIKDDAYGGDTNNDGNASTPTAGDWAGIRAENNAVLSLGSSTVRYASVGITANTTVQVTALNSNLTDNTYAIQNLKNFPVVNATDNWWGDPTGPYNANTNPGGQGNPVSDYVDFSNLALEPLCLIENRPPVVDAITAPIDPVQVNTQINANATFTDSDITDTHTAEWDWGDGSNDPDPDNVTEPSGGDPGNVTGSHIYTSVGVYTVSLTLTDSFNESDQAIFQFVVIYDPDAGFVTGGGWIDSPTGAYTPDPALTGQANFGFVSKYKKGQSIPDGNTQFNFHVADMISAALDMSGW